jgi:hypothetical protein
MFELSVRSLLGDNYPAKLPERTGDFPAGDSR